MLYIFYALYFECSAMWFLSISSMLTVFIVPSNDVNVATLRHDIMSFTVNGVLVNWFWSMQLIKWYASWSQWSYRGESTTAIISYILGNICLMFGRQSTIYIIMYRKEIYKCFQPIYSIVVNKKRLRGLVWHVFQNFIFWRPSWTPSWILKLCQVCQGGTRWIFKLQTKTNILVYSNKCGTP